MVQTKVFADGHINLTRKMGLSLNKVGNIIGKGENALYQRFFLLPTLFTKP